MASIDRVFLVRVVQRLFTGPKQTLELCEAISGLKDDTAVFLRLEILVDFFGHDVSQDLYRKMVLIQQQCRFPNHYTRNWVFKSRLSSEVGCSQQSGSICLQARARHSRGRSSQRTACLRFRYLRSLCPPQVHSLDFSFLGNRPALPQKKSAYEISQDWTYTWGVDWHELAGSCCWPGTSEARSCLSIYTTVASVINNPIFFIFRSHFKIRNIQRFIYRVDRMAKLS